MPTGLCVGPLRGDSGSVLALRFPDLRSRGFRNNRLGVDKRHRPSPSKVRVQQGRKGPRHHQLQQETSTNAASLTSVFQGCRSPSRALSMTNFYVTLMRPACFGELALKNTQPRAATVKLGSRSLGPSVLKMLTCSEKGEGSVKPGASSPCKQIETRASRAIPPCQLWRSDSLRCRTKCRLMILEKQLG